MEKACADLFIAIDDAATLVLDAIVTANRGVYVSPSADLRDALGYMHQALASIVSAAAADPAKGTYVEHWVG